MPKFEIGEKVKVLIDSDEFKKGDSGFICELPDYDGEYKVGKTETLSYVDDSEWDYFSEDDLALASRLEITWDNFEAGDVLINSTRDKTKVLARLGDVFLQSVWGNFDRASNWMTIAEAKKYQLTLEQPAKKEDVEELTVEEISKRLGKTIKVVK